MRPDSPIRVYLTDAGEVCIETRRHRTLLSREAFQATLDQALTRTSRSPRRASGAQDAKPALFALQGDQAA